MTLSGPSEAKANVRGDTLAFSVIDFIVRRSVRFTAREQPCVYPVVSVERGEALVRRRAARSPYTAL